MGISIQANCSRCKRPFQRRQEVPNVCGNCVEKDELGGRVKDDVLAAIVIKPRTLGLMLRELFGFERIGDTTHTGKVIIWKGKIEGVDGYLVSLPEEIIAARMRVLNAMTPGMKHLWIGE